MMEVDRQTTRQREGRDSLPFTLRETTQNSTPSPAKLTSSKAPANVHFPLPCCGGPGGPGAHPRLSALSAKVFCAVLHPPPLPALAGPGPGSRPACQSPPAQSPPAQSPPAQGPPAQGPPAQSPPAQSPPAQSPDQDSAQGPDQGPDQDSAQGPDQDSAQGPPAQGPPAQGPPAQGPAQSPPAHGPPVQDSAQGPPVQGPAQSPPAQSPPAQGPAQGASTRSLVQLHSELQSLRGDLDHMKSQHNKEIKLLMNELDEEKRVRLTLQMEVQRMKKQMSKLLDRK
ncbi:fibrous sheath CABYR-binding protein-like [Gadus macrocephalus]|uniref:fibrous sheath CABYR-binding protein-like n=1 Tax=Gadus macrocephalus TaxID=80720 RepID=UPI0028CB7151|nr:fibrous sheath CABYR-binding protein-like [Gadus macrocephalus]XP_059911829.1 fibrous sheath CABYR-binding protein-like [Gadus macrocephalus]XP_059911830.1 fibrous sheath CABYR-binding protein-like [Gadus macrocephalus]XP_059911832.1 fibrous sheath CABYR-binding protein-like [Gadus macrocephalus]